MRRERPAERHVDPPGGRTGAHRVEVRGAFAASGNKFAGNEVNIYGANGAIVTPGGHIKP